MNCYKVATADTSQQKNCYFRASQTFGLLSGLTKIFSVNIELSLQHHVLLKLRSSL
jgi:hypothetical protein